jgi:membrane-bound lytic murein transglycosylase A
LFFLAACAHEVAPVNAPLVLKPAKFSDLPGWGSDDLSAAIPAMQKSCERILKMNPASGFGGLKEAGTVTQWQAACQEMNTLNIADSVALRGFFERRFQPYQASAGGETQGLFTGYYEASLRGSKTQHDQYKIPLYARPDDLVMVDLGEFRPELKGQRIAGRVNGGQLKPYEDRATITAGRWPHNDQVLVWVDDAVDAFFVQVQGSGAVQMDDGSVMQIGYAGQNGYPYYAIGKELVKRGALEKDHVSMQSIREWLAAHPEQADEIMNTNKSYVFFKVLDDQGPRGGEGVALTPQRSMAVDRAKIPYGVPLWVDIEAPKLQRLMMAQDTGGAIIGAVRGDIFWGYGPQAEAMAGPMKSKGRYWLLLPR